MAIKEEREGKLCVAARKGQVEEVRVLLSEGVDKDCVRGKYDSTPLGEAARNNHVEVVQLLIEVKANINKRNGIGQTPLYWAALELQFLCNHPNPCL